MSRRKHDSSLQIEHLERRELLTGELIGIGNPVGRGQVGSGRGDEFSTLPGLVTSSTTPAGLVASGAIDAIVATRQIRAQALGDASTTDQDALRPQFAVRLAVIQSLPDIAARQEFAASREDTDTTGSGRGNESILAAVVASSATGISIEVNHRLPGAPEAAKLDMPIVEGANTMATLPVPAQAESLRHVDRPTFQRTSPQIEFDAIETPHFPRQSTQLRTMDLPVVDAHSRNADIPIRMIALAIAGPSQDSRHSFQVSDLPIPDVPLMIEAIAGWSRAVDVGSFVNSANSDDVNAETQVATLHPYLLGAAVVLSSGVSFQLAIQNRDKRDRRIDA